jgi:hypothetical protein
MSDPRPRHSCQGSTGAYGLRLLLSTGTASEGTTRERTMKYYTEYTTATTLVCTFDQPYVAYKVCPPAAIDAQPW